jgi:hypothetical protein
MNHRRTRALLAAVVVGASLSPFLLASPAHACSCGMSPEPPTEEEVVAQSDAVFVGTPVARSGGSTTSSTPDGVVMGPGEVVYTFEVDRVDNGRVRDPQEIVTSSDEASCGRGFDLGVAYRVFAYRDDEGRLADGLCSYTHRVDDEPRYRVAGPTTTAAPPTTTSIPPPIETSTTVAMATPTTFSTQVAEPVDLSTTTRPPKVLGVQVTRDVTKGDGGGGLLEPARAAALAAVALMAGVITWIGRSGRRVARPQTD